MGKEAGADLAVGTESAPPARGLVGALPQFDPRSRPIYILIAGVLAAELFLFLSLGFRVRSGKLLEYLVVPAAAIYSGTMFRRAGWPRMAMALEGAGLCGTFGHIVLLLQFPLASLAVGSPDALLLDADRLLGFDWVRFTRQFQDPSIIVLLREAYRSMIPQSALAVALLAYTERFERSWRLIMICLISLICSVLPLPFFAAVGRYVGCGPKHLGIAVLDNTCNFADAIHRVRDLGIRTIEPWMEVGIVSFPSFHAAAALILVWAIWPFRWLRAPAIALNILMCISAITIGQHYFVDILGGIALAAAILIVVSGWKQRPTQ